MRAVRIRSVAVPPCRGPPRRRQYPLDQQRPFVTLPTQTLTASRTLPHPSLAIYAIIADVDKYSSFLPYCVSSKVTCWSRPDKEGNKWPSEAELVVGWNGIEQSFTSRVFCVPGRIVEAIGGSTATTLRKEDIEHHYDDEGKQSARSDGEGQSILTHLLTRWTVRPFPYKPPPLREPAQEDKTEQPTKDHTEVSLAIEFQFSNPIYSAMSGAVADKVAGAMIEAFEARVRRLLEGPVVGLRERGSDGIAHRREKP